MFGSNFNFNKENIFRLSNPKSISCVKELGLKNWSVVLKINITFCTYPSFRFCYNPSGILTMSTLNSELTSINFTHPFI
jgi:hypothetical protein